MLVKDWPGTDQLGVLVTVASLALAIIYASGPFDIADATAGLIVLIFGVLYLPRIHISEAPVAGLIVAQHAFAWFLVVMIIVVGAMSFLLGVLNEPTWPWGPWLDTESEQRWADLGIVLLAVTAGFSVAYRQHHLALRLRL